MGFRCSLLIALSAVFLAGCSQKTDTPDEIASRGRPAESVQAPTQELNTVESVRPADAPPPVSKTLLQPVAESERVEVTRPEATPPQAVPPMRNEPPEPSPAAEPAAAEPPQDKPDSIASSDEPDRSEQPRRRRGRRSSSGPMMISLPALPPFGGSAVGENPFGGADFGSESAPQGDVGGFSPDEFSDGSEYGPPLSGSAAPGDYGDSEYADGGYDGGFDGGYPGDFGVGGDDLAEATDRYNPPADGGRPGEPGGPPTGPPDGGLEPTPPAPPPDF